MHEPCILRVCSGALFKHQIPHAVTEAQATVFELGGIAVFGARHVAGGIGGGVLQGGFSRQHFQHLDGVFLPVGGAVEIAAGGQARADQLHQGRLDQAALVVARLVPGIGEEHVHAGQGIGGDHVGEYFDGIVLDDAHVVQVAFADQLEVAADAGGMDFDADEVFLGHEGRDLGAGFAHAEADFEDGRSLATEGDSQVQRGLVVGDQEARTQFFQRAPLRDRHAPGAGDETADAALAGIIEQRLAGFVFRHG